MIAMLRYYIRRSWNDTNWMIRDGLLNDGWERWTYYDPKEPMR